MIVDKIEIDEDEKSINDNDNCFLNEPIKEESKKKIEKVNIIYII
jgi:hypothetical protein